MPTKLGKHLFMEILMKNHNEVAVKNLKNNLASLSGLLNYLN